MEKYVFKTTRDKRYTYKIILSIHKKVSVLTYTCTYLISIASLIQSFPTEPLYVPLTTIPENSLLYKHTPTLITYIDALKHVNGLSHVLNRLCKNPHVTSNFKGFLFELETAYNIQISDTDQRISKLSISLAKQPLVTIDIQTTEAFIECKNINWKHLNKKSRRSESVQSQLLKQQKLIDEYNTEHEKSYRFYLASKEPLTKYWDNWLKEHNIPIFGEIEQDLE